MQNVLDRLSIPLVLCWKPKPQSCVRGEVKQGVLFIYDDCEETVWDTLYHEVVEYKLKEVTQVYRTLVNQLIEGYEKLAYQQKEAFIEFLSRITETFQEAKAEKDVFKRGKA